jgi:NAD(P)-dependent dehydrogenase (short-subunit alcohol dehydrogenase family)
MSEPVAVITGGAVGIGAAIAARLANDGHTIAVADIDATKAEACATALRDAGHEARAFVVDVAQEDSVRALIAEVLAWRGAIDVLVNNAGITGPHGSFSTYDTSIVRRIIDIDGKDGNPNLAAYSAAKAGVIGFTNAVGRELASKGVFVNAVAPGGVGGTAILTSSGSSTSDAASQQGAVTANTPLGRLAAPGEIAALVSWLCSAECSYSTGAVYDISGGRATY